MDEYTSVKLAFVGDSGVGKSSVLRRYVNDVFDLHSDATVGASFAAKTIIRDGKRYKIEIWDTAGQERFRSLSPLYYRTADACLVMFDVMNAESFKNAARWLAEVRSKIKDNSLIFLVGNKIDALATRRVSFEEASEFANKENIHYFEMSAKNNIGIANSFSEIIKMLEMNEIINSKYKIYENVNVANKQSYLSYIFGYCSIM